MSDTAAPDGALVGPVIHEPVAGDLESQIQRLARWAERQARRLATVQIPTLIEQDSDTAELHVEWIALQSRYNLAKPYHGREMVTNMRDILGIASQGRLCYSGGAIPRHDTDQPFSHRNRERQSTVIAGIMF